MRVKNMISFMIPLLGLQISANADNIVTVDSLVSRADGGIILKEHEVGFSSKIDNKDFSSYPDVIFTNSLQGKMAGLQVRSTVNGLGNNNPEIYIRGLHGMDNNTAIVIIDGVERPLDDILPEEIESIEVLKDATAKILYGSRAANGVLWVKTKRGKVNSHIYRASAEMGLSQMTRTPEFIDSYNYAKLYNEARINDGLPAFYTQGQIQGYKNSIGATDFLYPNVDYYDTFLNNVSNYQKATFEMNGGTDRVRYSLVAGYIGAGGFEKGAYGTSLNRMTLRGNLDFKVADFLTISADVSGRLEMRKTGQQNSANVFSALSSHRPNEYPLLINPDDAGLTQREDGVPLFGASQLRNMNLYAEMMYGGYIDERYTRGQTNIGFDFDLGMITEGLDAGAFLSFDNYDNLILNLNKTYPTYSIDPYINSNGEQDYLITQLKKESIDTSKNRSTTTLQQVLGWNAFIGYNKSIGKNNIGARLTYLYNNTSTQGSDQNIINTNYSLRLNYGYDNKYFVEGDLALMGSNRFAKGNKHFLSSAAGVSWIISNEDFLKGNEIINFLKLKTSVGLLGFDRSTNYLLYEQSWSQVDDQFKFGPTNNGAVAYVTTCVRRANDHLKWEKSAEWNLGFEGLFFNNRLYTEMNYFRELRSDIIGSVDSTYGNYLGDFVYVDNMGKVFNHGFEADLSWKDKIGNFQYTIGANITWTKNKLIQWNQIMHDDEYRYSIGKSTDAMMGLVSEGLFGKDVSLDGHPNQSFGDYQIGDIAYQDLNSDKIIDNRDVKQVGNSFPRTTLGIDLDLKYKSWGLYIQGYSELGVNGWASNAYYWNYGEGKYSVLALDRYHPENNPNGTYPRLTTTEGSNNFRNSTFWLVNKNFFRLKNIELNYTFNKFATSSVVSEIKVFARGSNLFVLSSVKDLDPELLDAGVVNYPVCRNITAGVSFVF